MSASIFSGLSLVRAGGALEIRYPERLCPFERAAPAARPFNLEVEPAGETWRLRAPGASVQTLKAFFARLNGFPAPYPFARGKEEKDPLVSCIVVINENVPFVREQLVPSLCANSAQPIEIVLVYNGSAKEDPALAHLPSLRSEWSAVAAAYNAGVRAARGRHVALFHDDCVLDDPDWIAKCLAPLEGGASAVAGEFRRLETIAGVPVPPLPVAKCVPLVMRRDAFLASGGFDEFHYVGYEDLDFTLSLERSGGRLAPAELALRHFGGMSSTLKYCPVPGLDLLYAMAAVPAVAILRRFREFADAGVRLDGLDYLRLALDAQLFYVLKKYADPAYAAAQAALERRITKECPFDATLILPRFRELDRVLAGRAQGALRP